MAPYSSLSLLVLLLLVPFSTAITTTDAPLGKKLIRSLNLHPKHDVNVINTTSKSVTASTTKSPRLVEAKLSLPILGDSGAPSTENLGHHAGYFHLPNTIDARMFYFFFESRSSKSDPVVIWLSGGPGCNSEVALFYENGPYKITNNMSLVWNDYGWDKISNLIYVDQPTGTGFSYSSSDQDIRQDEYGVSNDLYNFLQEFFKAHPDYVNNDFYITGESYAGHYIPALASRINEANKNNEGIHINLKGMGIGNGLTEPGIQYTSYPDYALRMSMISQSQYSQISQWIPYCQDAVSQCDTDGQEWCVYALDTCQYISNQIMSSNRGTSVYDIRNNCENSLCNDFSNLENYFKLPEVREALGVGDIPYQQCSDMVHKAMKADFMRNLESVIPPLLEDGINLLVYAGEYDFICNWIGNLRWVKAMPWSGQQEFNDAQKGPFLVDGVEAGTMKSYGVLTFLKVHDAGHLVPMDQPNNALQMLHKWMQGQLSA